jgi:hypothetical protein
MPTSDKNTAEVMSRDDALEALGRNKMMRHLIDALDDEKDIGHYGRFTFASIARHFMHPDDLAKYLARDKDEALDDAKALVHQVNDADYSPPGPAKIRKWNEEQDFPILPPEHQTSDDANVYQDLDFPEDVYEKINAYHREQALAGE